MYIYKGEQHDNNSVKLTNLINLRIKAMIIKKYGKNIIYTREKILF